MRSGTTTESGWSGTAFGWSRPGSCSATSAGTTASVSKRTPPRARCRNWQERFVSGYASGPIRGRTSPRPGRTLHIVDALETAAAFGLRIAPKAGRDPALAMASDFDPYRQNDFDALLEAWLPLIYAVNS